VITIIDSDTLIIIFVAFGFVFLCFLCFVFFSLSLSFFAREISSRAFSFSRVEAGWLVVNIKNGTKWVHSGGPLTKSKLLPGCWDQPHLGVKFLGHMLGMK
jgi:hypothetical protein